MDVTTTVWLSPSATSFACLCEPCLEAARTGAYDLVLMDVHMPRMDGLAATRAIRSLTGPAALTPIVALTANVLPDQIAFYRASGMDDHLGKPIDARDLMSKIAAWGERRPGRDRRADLSP